MRGVAHGGVEAGPHGAEDPGWRGTWGLGDALGVGVFGLDARQYTVLRYGSGESTSAPLLRKKPMPEPTATGKRIDAGVEERRDLGRPRSASDMLAIVCKFNASRCVFGG